MSAKLTNRYVLVGCRGAYCYYVASNGSPTTNAENMHVFKLQDAIDHLKYYKANTAGFNWRIEQLPYGKKENAVLRAVELYV